MEMLLAVVILWGSSHLLVTLIVLLDISALDFDLETTTATTSPPTATVAGRHLSGKAY